jgi:arginyl-tRNA--protein-N-Asp/Glu arginylyltransferase
LRCYLQIGWQCGYHKSRVIRSQIMEPKDLMANSILYMLMRQQFQRLCSVFR